MTALYLPDISKWNASNVTNMTGIFSGCSSLKSLPDISKWNINNQSYLGDILFLSLLTIISPDELKYNINNINKLIKLFGDFSPSIYDISNWKTNNVIDIIIIFTWYFKMEYK